MHISVIYTSEMTFSLLKKMSS